MVHFLFGVPRLVYMIAPAFYLLLDLNTIVASAFDVVAYAFPHIFVSIVANSISSKSLRHTFWAEVYETSIGYYTAMATTLALLRPRHGKFAVTAKGFKGTDAFYDWRSARPVLFLIALNLLSVLAVPLNVWFKVGEGSSIFINSMWSLYNLIILGACAFVAYEQPETRSIWRHDRRLPVRLAPDGDDDASVWGETIDVALGGMRVALPAGVSPPASGELEMHYEFGHPFEASFDTRWTRDTESGCEIGLRLAKLDFDKQCELIRIIFGSASNWINGQYEEDRPLRSFTRVLVTPYRAWSAVRKKRATLRSAGANGGDLGDEGPEVTDGSGDDATDGSPAPH
jgi:cellulose synthase (UDP-forming)